MLFILSKANTAVIAIMARTVKQADFAVSADNTYLIHIHFVMNLSMNLIKIRNTLYFSVERIFDKIFFNVCLAKAITSKTFDY